MSVHAFHIVMYILVIHAGLRITIDVKIDGGGLEDSGPVYSMIQSERHDRYMVMQVYSGNSILCIIWLLKFPLVEFYICEMILFPEISLI